MVAFRFAVRGSQFSVLSSRLVVLGLGARGLGCCELVDRAGWDLSGWGMFLFLRPAEAIERLPAERVDAEYRRLRLRVFAGIFFGYAAFYLVRKNFSLAITRSIRRRSWGRR
jgi:hypothetical protein